MKNIEWKEFVDVAYFGADAFLRYKGRMYQIGGFYDTSFCIYVNVMTEDDYVEIFNERALTNEKIWQAFMAAKIFEGKTLEEAGDEVEFYVWG